jgi:ribulose-5-phosphate 4-epimerase/fuculose-1-phosphate aldolase
MAGHEQEGVVKYDLIFTEAKLSDKELRVARNLGAWRKIMFAQGLIGQEPNRYNGDHYGNLSARVVPDANRFVITGTQTSGLSTADPERHYAAVDSYDPMANTAVAHGPTAPSSELPTHAAIYSTSPNVHAVFHTHSPLIWRAADRLGIPTTADNIEYGTPEMAAAVQELLARPAIQKSKIVVMLGHEDGVISFGDGVYDAGATMMTFFRRAQALTA